MTAAKSDAKMYIAFVYPLLQLANILLVPSKYELDFGAILKCLFLPILW